MLENKERKKGAETSLFAEFFHMKHQCFSIFTTLQCQKAANLDLVCIYNKQQNKKTFRIYIQTYF